jgi:flagellar motility protein MotE (MotC chaperone)
VAGYVLALMSVAALQTIDKDELEQILKEFNMDIYPELADLFSAGKFTLIQSELAELKAKLENAESRAENAESRAELAESRAELAELKAKLENAELRATIEKMKAESAVAQIQLLSEKKG